MREDGGASSTKAGRRLPASSIGASALRLATLLLLSRAVAAGPRGVPTGFGVLDQTDLGPHHAQPASTREKRARDGEPVSPWRVEHLYSLPPRLCKDILRTALTSTAGVSERYTGCRLWTSSLVKWAPGLCPGVAKDEGTARRHRLLRHRGPHPGAAEARGAARPRLRLGDMSTRS